MRSDFDYIVAVKMSELVEFGAELNLTWARRADQTLRERESKGMMAREFCL